jgi:hypothetical protein
VSAGGIIGTPNYFAIFTSANAVGNSIVSQSGTQVSIAGSLVVSSNLTVDANLSVRGNLSISQDATIAGYLFSQAYFHQSDARLKENIVTITNATQIVQDLHGVYFNWNSTLGRTTQQQVGLIAQEVEQVVPQVIGTDANGYKAVQYENLVAVLIQAVKEQQAQINTLQTRVNELENKTQ